MESVIVAGLAVVAVGLVAIATRLGLELVRAQRVLLNMLAEQERRLEGACGDIEALGNAYQSLAQLPEIDAMIETEAARMAGIEPGELVTLH
jgi:hypothetical protein